MQDGRRGVQVDPDARLEQRLVVGALGVETMNWSPSSLTKSSTATPRRAAVVTAYSSGSSGTKYGLVSEIRFCAE